VVARFKRLGHRFGRMTIDIYRNKLIWKKKKKPVNSEFYGPLGLLVTLLFRDDKIRTCDPLHPMQVRYRAALRPEKMNSEGPAKVKKKSIFWEKRCLFAIFTALTFRLACKFA
jgi:hypothetical protein